jgi:hypothetical protein
VASAPDRDLESLGLAEGEGRRYVVRIDAAGDRRRATVDQQVEAGARPLVLAAPSTSTSPVSDSRNSSTPSAIETEDSVIEEK